MEDVVMVNVYIRGYSVQRNRKLKFFIDKIMEKDGLHYEAVTTIEDAVVESCDGVCTRKPYLYVTSTKKDDISLILSTFGKYNLAEDVFWDIIGGFFPAKDMVSPKNENRDSDCPDCCSSHEMLSGVCPSCGKGKDGRSSISQELKGDAKKH